MGTLDARATNTVKLVKGTNGDGLQYVSWDLLDDCIGEDCPIYPYCKTVYTRQSVKCEAQKHYLNHVYKTLVMNKEDLSQDKVDSIGLMVIPLYRQLFKLKVEESGIGSATLEDSKGKKYIHPLLREIRATIGEIVKTMRTLELGSFGSVAGPNEWLSGNPDRFEEYTPEPVDVESLQRDLDSNLDNASKAPRAYMAAKRGKRRIKR